jgi:hypothetical protein
MENGYMSVIFSSSHRYMGDDFVFHQKLLLKYENLIIVNASGARTTNTSFNCISWVRLTRLHMYFELKKKLMKYL